MNIQMECELGSLSCPATKIEHQGVAVQIPVEKSGRLDRLTVFQWDERLEVSLCFEKIDPERRPPS
jgi:hypothetical protein